MGNVNPIAKRNGRSTVTDDYTREVLLALRMQVAALLKRFDETLVMLNRNAAQQGGNTSLDQDSECQSK